MTIPNDTRLDDFLQRVSTYGAAEGQGLNAKPQYALDVIAASHDGVIGNDHAESVWARFQEASSGTKGDERLRVSNPKTTKVRVSETRKLIAVGAIAAFDPREVMARAVGVINGYADAKGSTYQNLVVVAREQLDRRAQPLTDEEILAAITPDAVAEKEEAELLGQLVKRMKKIHDGDEKDITAKTYPSPELLNAIKSLESRLAQLVTEQETKKMFELAAKQGFTLAAVPAEIVVDTSNEDMQATAA